MPTTSDKSWKIRAGKTDRLEIKLKNRGQRIEEIVIVIVNYY